MRLCYLALGCFLWRVLFVGVLGLAYCFFVFAFKIITLKTKEAMCKLCG
jgi:hypothetical protein